MHRHVLTAFLVAFFAVCSSIVLPARAQETATLRLVVRAADDGTPLEGANVRLRPPSTDALVGSGATNRDGYLALGNLDPGRYRIAISYVGYETHRDTLALGAGRRVYSVTLSPEPERLEEVTVEAGPELTRRQAGRQTIEPEQIGRIPTPGPSGDLASYLQTLPGVVSVGDRGGQLYVQGGAPTQNRYLVDGLPIVRPFHISSFYSAFPQNTVQSVDLYAGGFEAEYGEALSSVLDVRLRPGNTKRYAGSAAVGPHLASFSVEGPLVRGEQSFLLSARYSLLEQTAQPLWGQDAEIGFYDLTGRYTFQQQNATCNVTAVLTHDEGSIGAREDRTLSWSNTVVGGRCFFLDESFRQPFSVRGGYSGFHNTTVTAGAPKQEAGRWRAYVMLEGAQTLFGYPVDFGGRLTLGRYGARLPSPFAGVDQIGETQGMVRVHWSLDWAPTDYLTVVPSIAVRGTYSVRLSADPRVRLSLRPTGTDRQEISVAAGVYRQIDQGIGDQRDAGTVFTVWKPPAPDDPLPAAFQALLGYRYRLGSSLEVSVEGYAKRLANIPVPKWTPEVGVNTETARATGKAYGANARLEYRSGPFYAYLGYAWSKVTYEAATGDLGAWVEGKVFSYSPPHDRRHQFNVVSSGRLMGVTASVSWEYGSGRPYTQIYGLDVSLDIPQERPLEDPGTAQTLYQRPYNARLPAYHRLDVSLKRSFDLSGRLALDTKVGAINLYDRPNVFYYDADTLRRVNQSPLMPYFSAKLRLE